MTVTQYELEIAHYPVLILAVSIWSWYFLRVPTWGVPPILTHTHGPVFGSYP